MFVRSFVAAASVLSATAVTAQTHGQLLESAIFAEDTAGDRDGAIRIYQRLVSAPAVPPEVASRAWSRLTEARRQRDEAILVMARAAEQGRAGQAGQIDPPPAAPATRPGRSGGSFTEFYDASRQVSVVGTVTQVQWSDPNVVVYLNDADGKLWGFVLGPPANLVRSGWSRDTIQVGEKLHGDGSLARGVGDNCPGPLPNGCATFPNGALHVNARQLLRVDANGNLSRPGANQLQPPPGGGARGGRGGGGGAPPPQ